MINVALFLCTLIISLAILVSIPAIRHPVEAGIYRLKTLVSPRSQLPLSPLNEVMDWRTLRLVPGTCQIFDGGEVRISPTRVCINSDGFRDHDYPREKPPGVYRIVMLGDSHVFGWGVYLDDTLPKLLENELNSRSGTRRYEVLNMGVPAFGTGDEVALLREKGLFYHPDMTLFGFFHDDFRDWSGFNILIEDARRDYLAAHPQTSDEEAVAVVMGAVIMNLTAIEQHEPLSSLRSRAWPVLQELAGLAEREDLPIVFHVYSWYPSQGALLREASAEFNFTLIVLNRSFSGMQVHPADAHPSAEANRIRAEILADELRVIIG